MVHKYVRHDLTSEQAFASAIFYRAGEARYIRQVKALVAGIPVESGNVLYSRHSDMAAAAIIGSMCLTFKVSATDFDVSLRSRG